jgi:hypothetical protein
METALGATNFVWDSDTLSLQISLTVSRVTSLNVIVDSLVTT